MNTLLWLSSVCFLDTKGEFLTTKDHRNLIFFAFLCKISHFIRKFLKNSSKYLQYIVVLNRIFLDIVFRGTVWGTLF